MKGPLTVVAVALLAAGSALAQHAGPPADPLSVKPVPTEEQTAESASIRTKIEQAGYTDVTDVWRDRVGVWRARARKGGDAVDVVVDKGGRIKAAGR